MAWYHQHPTGGKRWPRMSREVHSADGRTFIERATNELWDVVVRDDWVATSFTREEARRVIRDHSRGRNWAAIIDIDPLQPGGLSRFWLHRGRGVCKYILPIEIRLYDAIEFAADYVRYSGRKNPERWYGIITELGEDRVTIQPYKDALSAVLASREKQRSVPRQA